MFRLDSRYTARGIGNTGRLTSYPCRITKSGEVVTRAWAAGENTHNSNLNETENVTLVQQEQSENGTIRQV